jgi:hypothetical protein
LQFDVFVTTISQILNVYWNFSNLGEKHVYLEITDFCKTNLKSRHPNKNILLNNTKYAKLWSSAAAFTQVPRGVEAAGRSAGDGIASSLRFSWILMFVCWAS